MREKKNVFKELAAAGIIALVVLVPVAAGCARTVTSPTQFRQLEITVEFEGDIDLANYLYYFFFSPVPVQVPTPNTTPPYFPTPGRSYDEAELAPSDNIQPYYSTFFSTWSDYLVVTENNNLLDNVFDVLFYPSNDSAFDATTTNNFSYNRELGFAATVQFDPVADTLTLVFNLNQLSVLGSPLYFNMGVSTWPAGPGTSGVRDESGYLIETVELQDPAILPAAGQDTLEQTDPSDPIPQSADIVRWRAKIL